MTTAEISRDFTFEASHYLPYVPEGHKCGRLHGHSYRVTVAAAGTLHSELGWVVDFAEIDAAVKPVIDLLDHRCLNDLPGLDNPTCELLSYWIWARISEDLPAVVTWLEVAETPKSRCRITNWSDHGADG